jgi:hypothetical protein
MRKMSLALVGLFVTMVMVQAQPGPVVVKVKELPPTAKAKSDDAWWTVQIKDPVRLSKNVTALQGSSLNNPRFLKGQTKTPGIIPTLADRILATDTHYSGVIVLDEEMELLAGTELGANCMIKTNGKVEVYVPDVVVTLLTGAQVTTETQLSNKDVILQFAKAKQTFDHLPAPVVNNTTQVTQKVGLTPAEFNKLLTEDESFKALAGEVSGMKSNLGKLGDLDKLKQKIDNTSTALTTLETKEKNDFEAALAQIGAQSLTLKGDEVYFSIYSPQHIPANLVVSGSQFEYCYDCSRGPGWRRYKHKIVERHGIFRDVFREKTKIR